MTERRSPLPEDPVSAEERDAAERLREALERADDAHADARLLRALHAAEVPSALDAGVHDVILARALDDAPSEDERRQAELLRHALDAGTEPSDEDAGLLLALRAAAAPREIGEAAHEEVLRRAIAKAPATKVVALTSRRPSWQRMAGPMAVAVAMAAAVVLFLRGSGDEAAPLAQARSTEPLFREPFASGETSARIDRIATARASDFRDNRFTRWGVR